MLNNNSIKRLIELHKQDSDVIALIQDALHSFEAYHASIYTMETWLTLYSYDNMNREDYRQEAEAKDRSRTVSHNAVIQNLSILNRLAAQSNLPPVYEGVVSEERPHRVEIADAVLAYVEELVKHRNK